MAARQFSFVTNALINAGLVVGSLLLLFLVGEFVVFRTILPASDLPRRAYVNDVIRYAPNQSGVWRIRNEIAAPYRINAQGWNSPHPNYPRERRAGVERIALIGDSFVEALQVPVDKSVAEFLERSRDGKLELYRFGLSGAPLSQYLQMMEREAIPLRPDRIVISLVHNDFLESFRDDLLGLLYRTIRIADGKVVADIPPTPLKKHSWATLAWAHSATVGFFRHRWNVRLNEIIGNTFGAARADTRHYAANIDVDETLRYTAEIAIAADYLIGRMAERARDAGIPLLLIMDADRNALYHGIAQSRVNVIARMAEAAAKKNNVAFLDLTSAFAADWAENKKHFEFESDYHWNEHGHAVVAGAIAKALWAGD